MEKKHPQNTLAKKNIESSNKKVNDEQQISEIRSQLKLYYYLGHFGKKYYKYYKKGILSEKLEKDFSYDRIELAKEYLEEKGPLLVKKRKPNNNKQNN